MKKKMKRAASLLLALVLALALAACSSGETQTEAGTEGAGTQGQTGEQSGGDETQGGDILYKIGVSQLTEHPALDASYEGFVAALADAGYVDGENITIDYNNAQGDAATCTTIAEKLVNGQCDLILAIATPAAQAAAATTDEIPILGTAITDYEVAGLVESSEVPGGNVSGGSDMNPVEDQIDLLTQLLPEAQTVAVMYCSSEDNSIVQAGLAEEALEAKGLEWVEYTVSDSTMIQSVAESMIGKVDAVYIPTDNLLAEGMAAVSMVTNENNLPCIVGEAGMVENGGLATYGLDYYDLGYKTGEMAVQVLEGADISTMPITYIPVEECTLTVNTTAAEQLGITIPEDILSQAEVVE